MRVGLIAAGLLATMVVVAAIAWALFRSTGTPIEICVDLAGGDRHVTTVYSGWERDRLAAGIEDAMAPLLRVPIPADGGELGTVTCRDVSRDNPTGVRIATSSYRLVANRASAEFPFAAYYGPDDQQPMESQSIEIVISVICTNWTDSIEELRASRIMLGR